MGKTKIEWADQTVNPIRARDIQTGATGHWCVKKSPGCKHCYASGMQKRFHMHEYVAGNRDKVQPFFDETQLDNVIARKIPSIYFWCSMTDMFLEEFPDEWIDRCFATMYEANWHVHMVLTKVPERMKEWSNDGKRVSCIAKHAHAGWKRRNPDKGNILTYTDVLQDLSRQWPLPQVLMGTSVENSDYLWRLDELAGVKTHKRFLSAEPLLGTIDLQLYLGLKPGLNGLWEKVSEPILDYVIAGGESGVFARPCPPDAPRLLRDQCAEAGVPFHFKQWGTWCPYHDLPEETLRTVDLTNKIQQDVRGTNYVKLNKKLSGGFLDGKEHREMPVLEVLQ